MPIVTLGNKPGNDFSGAIAIHIYQGSPFDTQTTFDIGKFSSGAWRVGILELDWAAAVPAGSIVNSVNVKAELVSDSGSGSHVFTSRQLLSDWVETEVSWIERNDTDDWDAAGALTDGVDVAAATLATSEAIPAVSSTEYELLQDSANLRAHVEDVVNSVDPNYGIRIERTDGADDSQYRLFGYVYATIDYTAGGASTTPLSILTSAQIGFTPGR